jgi:S-adenosylmethionine decarboxylase
MINEYWGYHLILDCGGGDVKSVTNKKHIENFARDLVQALDMTAWGKPIVAHFTHPTDQTKTGYTLVQLITTSSITAHFVEHDGSFYLDIFSCKVFDGDEVIRIVKEYFSPTKIRPTFLVRQA